MKISLFLISIIVNVYNVFSQDFYLESSTQAKYIYKGIDPKWSSLSESEARNFLINSNFSNIQFSSENGANMYIGEYRYGKKYIFHRILTFREHECVAYTDLIQMFRECARCLTLSVNPNDPYVGDLNRKIISDAEKFDNDIKKLFIDEIEKSFNKDGITEPLFLMVPIDNWNIEKEIEKGDFRIRRIAKLERDYSASAYKFVLSRTTVVTMKPVEVSGVNLKDINTYDLKEMIKIFLEDCKNHGININEQIIKSEFKTLDKGVLGLSYGKDNDELIDIKVDPEQWSNASNPKKWYLIYHELGHDVLNLKHGEGGKMMFNFSDKSYSWKDFLNEKEYMFNSLGFSSPKYVLSQQEIKLGNQIWMSKNLNVTKFRNGDPIPHAKTAQDWIKASKNKQPAWCFYENDSSDKNGRLYNWYAVNDPRGIAPEGWRVASDEDWILLAKSLGNHRVGYKLKSKNGWGNGFNGSNESGLNFQYGGMRSDYRGQFENAAVWWTSTSHKNNSDAYFRNISKEDEISGFIMPKGSGFYVRCVKNN